MITKFKNLRRPARAEKVGIVVQPPLQKSKKNTEMMRDHVEPSVSDTAEYQRHIEFLQTKYNSKKWSLSSMLTLLQQTGMQRNYWIRNENPTVKMVLDKFPCLADSKVVSFFNS